MIDTTHIPTATTRADQLRPVVRQWVGQTFFGTLMRQARESGLGPEESPLGGGHGGGAFREMLDGRLAEAASRGAGDKLVDALVNRLA